MFWLDRKCNFQSVKIIANHGRKEHNSNIFGAKAWVLFLPKINSHRHNFLIVTVKRIQRVHLKSLKRINVTNRDDQAYNQNIENEPE